MDNNARSTSLALGRFGSLYKMQYDGAGLFSQIIELMNFVEEISMMDNTQYKTPNHRGTLAGKMTLLECATFEASVRHAVRRMPL